MDRLSVPELPEISREEIDSWTIQVLGEEWVFCTRALLDHEDGGKGLEVLCHRLEGYGRSKTYELAAKFGAPDHGPEAIEAILDGLNKLFHQVGHVNVRTTYYWEKEITECPFRNAPGEMCRQFEAFCKGICQVLDPSYEVVHAQAMCAGDVSCIRAVRKVTRTP